MLKSNILLDVHCSRHSYSFLDSIDDVVYRREPTYDSFSCIHCISVVENTTDTTY